MSEDLFLEGKKFISVKRAASFYGYAQDYLGQLCRGGKLNAKLVGRAWFVEQESLEKYLKLVDSKKVKNAENVVVLSADIGKTSVHETSSFQGIDEATSFLPPIDLPKLSKRRGTSFDILSPALPHRKFLLGSTYVVSVFILLSSAYAWTEFLNPNLKLSFDQSISRYYDSLAYLQNGAFSKLRSTMQLSSSLGSLPAADDMAEGMVVFPDSPERENKVDSIKNNFSDEVEVFFDEDGKAGVIKPVFKSNEVGEDYAFVMVPIKQKVIIKEQ